MPVIPGFCWSAPASGATVVRRPRRRTPDLCSGSSATWTLTPLRNVFHLIELAGIVLSRSERDHFAFPLREAAVLRVTEFAGELDGFAEIHGDFARRVGVRSESDRHGHLGGDADDL